jgi:hypothetical protein
MHASDNCQCVLSQENPDDSGVCRARSLGPSDTADTCTVNESLEDELAALVLRGCSEDGNGEEGHCRHAEHMPPHRDVIQIFEDAHAEGVNRACIGFALGLEGLDRLDRGCMIMSYLGRYSSKNRSVDSDRLVRVQFIVRTDGSCSGNKVGTGKAGRRNAN